MREPSGTDLSGLKSGRSRPFHSDTDVIGGAMVGAAVAAESGVIVLAIPVFQLLTSFLTEQGSGI